MLKNLAGPDQPAESFSLQSRTEAFTEREGSFLCRVAPAHAADPGVSVIFQPWSAARQISHCRLQLHRLIPCKK